MTRLGHRHLDQNRALTPRDYATDPWQYGTSLTLTFELPAGGTRTSLLVAAETHTLLAAWNAAGRQPSAARLCELFGFSRQTLSKVNLGHRWPGETVLAALTYAARERC